MKIDIEAARLGRTAIDLISRNDMLSDDLMLRYYNCDGIRFLKEHLKFNRGFELTIDYFKHILSLPNEDSVFERSVHLGLSKLHIFEDVYFVDLQNKLITLDKSTMSMVRKYLPNNIDFPEITVYFLFGIRGTAIVLNNKIAIDLCDDSLYVDGSLSFERLQQILAHEIHHIGVSVRFKEFVRQFSDEKELLKYSIIENIISEGMACFYFTPEITKLYEKQWSTNLTEIDKKIEELRLCLFDSDITEKETTSLQDSLFDDSLLGYAIGYVMIERIHHKLGMDRMIKLLNDFSLFEVYAELGE